MDASPLISTRCAAAPRGIGVAPQNTARAARAGIRRFMDLPPERTNVDAGGFKAAAYAAGEFGRPRRIAVNANRIHVEWNLLPAGREDDTISSHAYRACDNQFRIVDHRPGARAGRQRAVGFVGAIG